MTLKEIAGLLGKTDRRLRQWITSEKSSDDLRKKFPMISEKISEAYRKKKPADFTLDESIAIVRAGGNETLANLLAENALNRDTATAIPADITARLDRLERMLDAAVRGITIANNSLMQMVIAQNNAQLMLPAASGEQLPEWVKDIARKADDKARRMAIARKDEIPLPFNRKK